MIEVFTCALAGMVVAAWWTTSRYLRRRSESKAMAAFLFDRNDPVVQVDARGRCLRVNGKATEVFGYSQDEFETMSASSLGLSSEVWSQAQSGVVERDLVHKCGRQISCKLRGAKLPDRTIILQTWDCSGSRSCVPDGHAPFNPASQANGFRHVAGDLVAVFDVIPSALCVTDLEGRILRVNASARQHLSDRGPSSEIVGQRYVELIERDRMIDRERAAELQIGLQAVASGETILFETTVPHDALLGTTWWLIQVMRVPSPDAAMLIVHHDMTERKAIELRLLANERMLRNVIDSEPQCVKVIDREGTILDMNASGLAMLEGDREEILGANALAWVQSGSRVQVTEALAEVFAGKSMQIEYEMMSLLGTRRIVESSFVPLRNASGEIDQALSVTRDVTEHRQALAALQMSEERFRRVVETAGDAIFTCSLDGRLDSLNPAFEDVLGLERDEWVGRPFRDLVHADDWPMADQAFGRCLRGDPPGHFELRIRHANGTYRIGEFRTVPMFRADAVTGLVGVGRDITERKEKDRRLRESEERYRNLFEEELTGKFVSHPSGKVLTCNSAFARMFGYPNKEAVFSTDVTALYNSPSDRKQFLNELRDKGALYHHESDLRRVDGRLIHVVENVVGKFNSEGELVEIQGSLIDVTDQRMAQQRILDQTQYLDQAQDGIVVTNMERQIIYWNKSAERLFGWSAEEALGSDIQHLLFLQRNRRIDQVYHDILVRDDVQEEWEIPSRSGSKAVFQSRWSVVRDDRGTAKSVISIHSDITEKKRIESQFLRAQRLESVGVLASGIAHDLNNILSAVGLAAHLLKRKYSNDHAAELLTTIESSVERGADIVKQVLLFTRGGDGERKPVDILELVGEMSRIVKETFPKSIELRAMIDPNLGAIHGDRTQLHQVLMNLCVNARDAMSNGGTLMIAARHHDVDEAYARMNMDVQPGTYVMVEVRDTGTGIPSDVLDRIFDPFFTTKELGKGTGLGLSTVLGIVKSHGGFVRVYSELGKGTKFSIYLPVKEGRTPEKTEHNPVDLRGHGEMILLVDDEKPVRQVACTALEENGYRVVTAENGADAAALLADHKDEVRAVVLDMLMPVMDGWMTSHAIGKMAPTMPIIATSGFQDRWSERRPENIVELIEKPYTAQRLLRSIRDILDHRNASA